MRNRMPIINVLVFTAAVFIGAYTHNQDWVLVGQTWLLFGISQQIERRN